MYTFSSTRNGSSGKAGEANPFEEEEWDENDALVDNGEPGVPVKALYDYEGAENDELSFKQGTHPFLLAFTWFIVCVCIGDVFEKLEDEDEQGWCKGRKDGRVGLYPANYVELVSHWCNCWFFFVVDNDKRTLLMHSLLLYGSVLFCLFVANVQMSVVWYWMNNNRLFDHRRWLYVVN